jgi:hypothetical protein
MPEWVFWVVGFAVIAGLGAYGAAQRTKQAEGLARKLGFRFIGPGGYDVVGPFVLLGYPTTSAPASRTCRAATGRGRADPLRLPDRGQRLHVAGAARAGPRRAPRGGTAPVDEVRQGARRVRPRLSVPFEFAERPGFRQLYWATGETPAGLEVFTPALLDRLERDPGFYLETIGDRVLVARTRLTPSGTSRLLTDDEVPAFLDEAMELFRLVAVRRGWAPPRPS